MNRRQFNTALALSPLLPSQLFAKANPWQSAEPLPLKVQEIYPAVHNGRLYVAGGIASKLKAPYFTNRCVSYDPDSNSWREEASLPEDLHHAALASQRGRLLLAGGFNGSYSRVWQMRDHLLELTDEGWQPVGTLPHPQAEGIFTPRPGGELHLVTGQTPRGDANSKRSDHREVTAHWLLMDQGNKWEAAAPIPTARNSATGGWVEQQLIVTGGRTADGNLSVTEIYDAAEDRWRDARPLPLPQAGTASVVVDDGIIVFGGEIFVPEPGVFPNVWRYSLSTDRWEALADLPTPRHGLGAGLLDNRIHVVGGATAPGGSGTSDAHEVYTPT